jgi:hypothetical protein
MPVASAPLDQDGAPPSISDLLDRYQKGGFDAPTRLASATDPTQLRSLLIKAADAWIGRDSSDIINRRLVATAFAIELAQARLAFDNPTLIIVLDWAKKEWHKGSASPAERVWTRAALALVERSNRISPARATSGPMAKILRSTGRKSWIQTFIDDAVDRFPDDARVRLARVLSLPPSRDLNPLVRLTADPEIGPDALVELAFLMFRFERDDIETVKRLEAATRLAEQAVNRAVEPWTRYVGHFIAALVHEQEGRYQDAMREYGAALKTVPHAQSASIALAQLLLRDNQPDAAFDLINRSMTERPDGDDPWRLFEYREYVRWPALIAEVRKAIR